MDMRRDAVRVVVGHLLGAAAIGFLDGLGHRAGHAVGVQDGAAFDVARAAADRLDERGGAAQVAFLVGVEDRDERNFGQIEAFAQQVDADQHVEFAAAQVAQDAHALERIDFRVHVAAAHAGLGKIFSEIFGHALGERGDQHALVAFRALANFFEQIIHLPFYRAHFDLRVHQARGANHLLDHHSRRARQLVRPGRRRNVEHLPGAVLEFLEIQRAVVERRGHAEAVVHKRLLARAVAVIHGVELRNRSGAIRR